VVRVARDACDSRRASVTGGYGRWLACPRVATFLVSDHEREYTVGLLRGHWLSGRLTAEEFEERVGEAWRARSAQDLWQALRFLPVERPVVREEGGGGSAVSALVIGLMSLCLMVFTLGFAFPLVLPLGITAWALGRDARRSGPRRFRGLARGGEVTGVAAAVWAALMLAGCTALVV
jgi:Domain of unknown function (DUF1707)